MSVQIANKFKGDGFYQYVPDPTGKFPICKPYGTPGGDKDYEFSTSLWSTFDSSSQSYLANHSYQRRSTRLRENFDDNPITNDEWNALLIKIRQEFMLRNNFMNGPGTLQPMSAQLDSQNGHSGYMASGDKIRQSDIEKIFSDILTLFKIELPAKASSSVNDRLPVQTFPLSVDKSDSIITYSSGGSSTTVNTSAKNEPDFAQLDYNPNASEIDVGSRYNNPQGNQWFNGSDTMREYVYRHSGIQQDEINNIEGNTVVSAHEPDNLLTSDIYGYSTQPIYNLGEGVIYQPKRRPYGNIDYVKYVTYDDGIRKPAFDVFGYIPSDLYTYVYRWRTALLGGMSEVGDIDPMFVQNCIGTRETVVKDKNGNIMKDVNGNPIKQTETRNFSKESNITVARFCMNPLGITRGEYTLNIAGTNVATYFMKAINLISSLCVCNCNYCSCFGHEASCACYVVKVCGWCYSYQYIV